MNVRLFGIALIGAALILGGGAGLLAPAPARAAPVIQPEGFVEFVRPDGSVAARLVVEIADTPERRARGLMGRVLRDYTAGMLFLFEKPAPQVFWMRNTPSSLDIIFIDGSLRVINIAGRTAPMSDRHYASAAAALMVVEALAGFADRFGIRAGDTLRWRRLDP
ncbi:MAG: DUF192 domain-containing protein [Desulfobacterales bacterium]|jgi:hypothetical protein|nr:DUF192 domain-containing protein [Desulfobacterales bacterium]